MPRSFQRVAGLLAVIAGPLAWGSLALGLSAVGFDFERFSDPSSLLTLGAAGAPIIRWSFFLSMLGAYLLLVPLVVWLGATLAAARPGPALTAWCYAGCGVAFLVLGALGAAILGAVWPALMVAQALAFTTATQIAEDGLQGLVQNIAGGVWLIGSGALLWRQRRVLGGSAVALGVCLLATALGSLLGSEALNILGLTATVLLLPLWGIAAGLVALRAALPAPPR